MLLGKALLVCSERCEEVERCLETAGCSVTRAIDGEIAVSSVRREMFDAAVLVSTGQEMDLAETVLNLRDLRKSMPILIVTGVDDGGQNAVARAVVEESVPNTKVLSLEELRNFLWSRKNSAKRAKRRYGS
jgi:DNA-binding response OmpR family regulator